MRTNIEKYEALLESANEAANAYLDMEGGAFLLSWTGELIQDLVTQGVCSERHSDDTKFCDAVSVDVLWAAYEDVERAEKLEWLHVFAEALMECVEEAKQVI